MTKIDYLKALATISVIILHSVPTKALYPTFSQLHIWNAVPVFIILMSFTTYISLSKKDSCLKNLYSFEYLKKRFKRILIPLIPVFILTLIIAKILNKDIYLGWQTFIGHMPLVGKGNYYITLLIEYIILSPLLYWTYKKFRIKSIVYSLFINFGFELICKFIEPDHYLYSSFIFRYLFLIYLGFYLFEIIKSNFKLNTYIFIGFAFSFIYLILCSIVNLKLPLFLDSWKTQLFISNFYPIILVYLLFKFLPHNLDIVIPIGKASYHIFLTQMVYFSVDPVKNILELANMPAAVVLLISLIINIIICLTIGIFFFKINSIYVNTKQQKIG